MRYCRVLDTSRVSLVVSPSGVKVVHTRVSPSLEEDLWGRKSVRRDVDPFGVWEIRT